MMTAFWDKDRVLAVYTEFSEVYTSNKKYDFVFLLLIG